MKQSENENHLYSISGQLYTEHVKIGAKDYQHVNTYDGLLRLINQTTLDTSDASKSMNYAFEYDANGNRTTKAITPITSSTEEGNKAQAK